MVGASRGLEDAQRDGVVPQTRPPARDADLDQHLDRPRRLRVAKPRVERLDAGDRVDQAVEIEPRVARERLGQPADRPAIEHLVRDHDPADTEARHHLGLADGRRGDAPRACRKLVREQLRRHRRLAVRRERDAVLVAEPHHAREVVLQAIGAHGHRRQQQVSRPQRQTQLSDLPERNLRELVRESLGADAQRRLEDRIELDRRVPFHAAQYHRPASRLIREHERLVED